MRAFEERIKKGIEAISKAKAEGRDTTEWEDQLLSLITGLPNKKETVLVKMGKFGFCTCLLSSGLCSGCWRVRDACECREIEVDPEEEITRQYAKTMSGVH
jgi:hypothetical protein